MDNILFLMGAWFSRLKSWLKRILNKTEIEEEAEDIPLAPPAAPFEESDFDIPHTQEEFNEASSGGGPGQDAGSPEQKSEIKQNVAKPKALAPPRR